MSFLPVQAAESCLRRARRFLQLADQTLPVNRVKNDLRRMALVMAVAAIDSYMHAIVLRRISAVRKTSDLPKPLARLDIAFSDVAALADSSIEAQRAKRSSRPWVHVKNFLQQRLLQETFQSYDQVAIAMAMAGISKAPSKIATELGNTPLQLKTRLNALVHRRNQIVHEGDLKRKARPRRLQFNGVTHTDVVTDLDWVESLIEAIERVVAQEP